MTPSPSTLSLVERLEALARKATPGPWTSDGFAMEDDAQVRVCTTNGTETYYHTCAHIAECGTNYTGDPDVDDLRPGEPQIGVVQAERNAAFIAACDPQTILKLIAALRSRTTKIEGVGNEEG